MNRKNHKELFLLSLLPPCLYKEYCSIKSFADVIRTTSTGRVSELMVMNQTETREESACPACERGVLKPTGSIISVINGHVFVEKGCFALPALKNLFLMKIHGERSL